MTPQQDAEFTPIAARIRGRDKIPFLHSYAHNTGAITLYQALGFDFRRKLIMTTLTRG